MLLGIPKNRVLRKANDIGMKQEWFEPSKRSKPSQKCDGFFVFLKWSMDKK